MQPAYNEAREMALGNKGPADLLECINKRGARLSTKKFRTMMNKVLSNLYIHANSKEDLDRDADHMLEVNWYENSMRH